MPTIRLYKTKLDQSNRMGTLEEYQSYIYSLSYQEVEIKQPFVEKNNHMYIKYFNDELENGSYDLYNYALIDGVFGDVVPAFVKLSPLATEGYRVDVSVDYWYKYLRFKYYGGNIDLHGKCIRANVNEWEEYNEATQTFSKPTLKNTYLTQEENVAVSDMERGTINRVDRPVIISLPENYAYIYIYFNNPKQANLNYSAVGESSALHSFFGSQRILEPQLETRKPKSLQGALACGTINLETGFCCFSGRYLSGSSFVPITDNTVECCCYLRELTNSYITTIYITDVPPNIIDVNSMYTQIVSFEIPFFGAVNERVYIPVYNSDEYCFKLDYSTSDDGSLPHIMYCPATISSSLTIQKRDVESFNLNFIWRDDELYKSDENYSNSIVKARSFIYNPLLYMNTIIDTLHSEQIEISITADGRQFIAMIDSDILLSNERIVRSVNPMLFTPDTVKDYWSIINAERTCFALEAVQTEALFNASIATVDSARGGFNSIGNMTGGASGGGGAAAAGGALDLISNISKRNKTIIGSVNTYMLAETDKIFAEAQKQNGVVSSSVPTGYYGSQLHGYNTTLSYAKLSRKSLDTVTEQLHRYGYATFLLLEDVLENHKREKFNYIQASQVELHGCDTDLAQDIISMFQNGVHLWHTNDVGNYNTTNYQVNV